MHLKIEAEFMQRNWLVQAKEYLDNGWAVIPIVAGEKFPPRGFRWKPYQERLPTLDELKIWEANYPRSGLAVVTGQVSGLAVIDADGPTGIRSLKKLGLRILRNPIVLTPSGGAHIYCSHPGFEVGSYIKSLSGLRGIDLKIDGGFVILPSDAHGKYEWFVGPEIVPVPLPAKILDLIRPNVQKIAPISEVSMQKKVRQQFLQRKPLMVYKPILKGHRNDTIFFLACAFAQDSESYERLKRRIVGYNQKWSQPPLLETEIETICRNAWNYKQRSLQSR
ncbi:MAG: bifunctional DNA primase/polymerase [Elusimicrobiota bacterium]